ncbi:MAG: hypothetical protein H6Q86_2709 [candidate division NC10 bacterium]|nr:hypothetical protein [candidate division NC10 bacterium]
MCFLTPGSVHDVNLLDQVVIDRRWLVFLTNNGTLPALTIAQLYECRWQIEPLFK